jgi:hypothetical protein
MLSRRFARRDRIRRDAARPVAAGNAFDGAVMPIGVRGRLREATNNYEPFRGGALAPNQDVPVHDAAAMAAVQAEVQDAEDALWQLREELLGWARPAWAPNAALVADWFSDEDRIYDEA